MPCRTDDFEDTGFATRLNGKIVDLEAMLCGILSFLEKDGTIKAVLEELNYPEMGITKRELLRWWSDHKAKDAVRRSEEERLRKKEELKAQALGKLSPEERKALGL